MTAALYRFRSEFRHGGWRFVVGMALLFGLVGGIALVSAAGARRGTSAFDRLVDATNASHVLVNAEDEETAELVKPDVLRAIDGVEEVTLAHGVLALIDGKVKEAAVLAPGPGSVWIDEVDRPVVNEGRLPDQSEPDELFANPSGAATAGLRVGDSVEVTVVSSDELTAEAQDAAAIERLAAAGTIGTRVPMRLVGIGVTPADVVPGAQLDALYLTRAFSERFPLAPGFTGTAVRLSGGSPDIDAFIGRVRDKVGPAAIIDFQTLSSDADTMRRAIRPQVVALGVVAAVVAIGICLAVGQALSRRAASLAADATALRALGSTRRDRLLVDGVRVATVATAGSVVAVITATLISPLMPLGLARDAEPARGFDVDAFVLIGGAGAMTASLVAIATVLTRRADATAGRPRRSSRLASWLRVRSAKPPVALGVGLALEPGGGRAAVSARSTLFSATIGVVAIVGCLTFASSLDRLLVSPRDFGSDFDAWAGTGDLGDEQYAEAFAALASTLENSDLVDGWSDLYAGQITLRSGVVPANGLRVVRHGAAPTVVTGRLPVGGDEIALGATTMRDEGVDIGDSVTVGRGAGNTARRFEVVGQVILPGVRNYLASDQAALGVGALLSADGLASVLTDDENGDALGEPTSVLIAMSAGSTVGDLQQALDDGTWPGAFEASGPIESSDIQSLARIRSTPKLLAALLAVIAIAAVGHSLVVAVRRGRRDAAIVRTIGFTPGEIAQTVAWHATTVAVVAGVIGLPLGLAGGRLAWGALAGQLGIVNNPVTPTAAVLLAIPVAILLANLAAVWPGRRSARLLPAEILRAE